MALQGVDFSSLQERNPEAWAGLRASCRDAIQGEITVRNANVRFVGHVLEAAEDLGQVLSSVPEFKVFVKSMAQNGVFRGILEDRQVLALTREAQRGARNLDKELVEARTLVIKWLNRVADKFKDRLATMALAPAAAAAAGGGDEGEDEEDEDEDEDKEVVKKTSGADRSQRAQRRAPPALSPSGGGEEAVSEEATVEVPSAAARRLSEVPAAAGGARALTGAALKSKVESLEKRDRELVLELEAKSAVPISLMGDRWAKEKAEQVAVRAELAALNFAAAAPSMQGGGSAAAANAAAVDAMVAELEEDCIKITIKISREDFMRASGGARPGLELPWRYAKQEGENLLSSYVGERLSELALGEVVASTPDDSPEFAPEFVLQECWLCGFIGYEADDAFKVCTDCEPNRLHCEECQEEHQEEDCCTEEDPYTGLPLWRLVEERAKMDSTVAGKQVEAAAADPSQGGGGSAAAAAAASPAPPKKVLKLKKPAASSEAGEPAAASPSQGGGGSAAAAAAPTVAHPFFAPRTGGEGGK